MARRRKGEHRIDDSGSSPPSNDIPFRFTPNAGSFLTAATDAAIGVVVVVVIVVVVDVVVEFSLLLSLVVFVALARLIDCRGIFQDRLHVVRSQIVEEIHRTGL